MITSDFESSLNFPCRVPPVYYGVDDHAGVGLVGRQYVFYLERDELTPGIIERWGGVLLSG